MNPGDAASTINTISTIALVVDGKPVDVTGGGSLLDVLREQLGIRSAKDGCSPQGQCGCCTVLVDGQPRVSCVTPVNRVAGRTITTVDGLADRDGWARTFAHHGATQCGFCTPGIIVRAAAATPERRGDRATVAQMLLAHQCRCTGWQPVVDAILAGPGHGPADGDGHDAIDGAAAERRAHLEGGVAQRCGPEVACGAGGFADDTAPPGCQVALRGGGGEWVLGDTLTAARQAGGKVQGRRTTAPPTWPIDVPDGHWVRTLQTTWVEPGYLEPDASWCLPGGDPCSSHGNGGAFGGKLDGELGRVARRLADTVGAPVRVLHTREDVVRRGPKRPPLAIGVRPDGSGVVRVATTPGVRDLIEQWFPTIEVVEVDVVGPPTSLDLRGAVWAEIAAVLATLGEGPECEVRARSGAVARADVTAGATGAIGATSAIEVKVECGEVLDAIVLRSYCVGAAHMALGMVTSEALAVGTDGVPHDLTMRSFGVLRAVDTPPIRVVFDEAATGTPVAAGEAVFAAVLAAVWRSRGYPARWPAGVA